MEEKHNTHYSNIGIYKIMRKKLDIEYTTFLSKIKEITANTEIDDRKLITDLLLEMKLYLIKYISIYKKSDSLKLSEKNLFELIDEFYKIKS